MRLISPQHPELMTNEEVVSYREKAKLVVGKFAVAYAGIGTLGVGAMMENIPLSFAGAAAAAYGILSGTKGSVELAQIDQQPLSRPQADTLPLEYSGEN